MSVKRTLIGQAHPVRQPWTAHGKADNLIAGRENGRCPQLAKQSVDCDAGNAVGERAGSIRRQRDRVHQFIPGLIHCSLYVSGRSR